MTVKIYQLKDSNREVHMMGDYVGVSFRLKHYSRLVASVWSRSVTETWERDPDSAPYINFYEIRQGSDGKYYADDDSPVSGGLTPRAAIKLAIELKQACDYIQNEEWKK